MVLNRSFFLLVLFTGFSLHATQPQVRGLVLVSSSQKLLKSKELKPVKGVEIYGVIIPGSQEKFLKYLQPYLGTQLNRKQVIRLKRAIISYFHKHDHPIVSVEIPEQDVSNHVVQFVVTEAKLGAIEVEGNRYFSSKRIRSYMRGMKPGNPIVESRLISNLRFVNLNVFRHVDAIFAPGKAQDSTDIILRVKDRFPAQFYAGVDNTGVPTTKRNRVFAGVILADTIWIDQIFSYQYTASFDFHRFQAHTGNYVLYLPWQDVLNIYGGYALVHADLPFTKRHTGQSWQASLRYDFPFWGTRHLRPDALLGFDFKRTNNTVQFNEDVVGAGLPGISNTYVNLTQLMIGINFNYQPPSMYLDFDFEVFGSPGKWLPDQSDADYQSLRPHATNQWLYAKTRLKYDQRLPWKFLFSALFEGQISISNLLPSEQIGLGGYNSVRGYDERQENKDSGIILSGEIRTPQFPIFMRKGSCKDGLQFLFFTDYGWGTNHNAINNEPKSQWLLGIGPGARYIIGSYLRARLDWGIKMHQDPSFTGGSSMWHFSVIGTY